MNQVKERVLVAMSGGVDSSAAVSLLSRSGLDCLGCTMLLHSGTGAEAADAESVCKKMGIRHITVDLSEKFEKQVIDRFVTAYEQGETPNPCIDCNRCLKFGELFDIADKYGCDKLSTGHYARIGYDDISGRWLLKKALRPEKDQSYVLYQLTQAQLERVVFPLGELSKDEVRSIAGSEGFVNARKHDSQDICFIPDGDYVSYIERRTGKTYPPGDFVDMNGRVLGRHSGLIRYTIGQRKGLGISLGERAYVCRLDPDANTVTLGRNSDLFSDTLYVRNINLISVSALNGPLRAAVKIRYSHREQPAEIVQLDDDLLRIRFDTPQRAVTLGQSAVIYSGDNVVGGGKIVKE